MLRRERGIQNTRDQGRLGENGTLEKRPEEMEELAMTLAEEIICQAEGRANPKALMWDCP